MYGPYIPNFVELFLAADPRGGGGRGLALGLFFSTSMYEAGTSPLPPSSSATLTHPEPSSGSTTLTISPSVIASSNGDVGVKSNTTRAVGYSSSGDFSSVRVKEDAVGVVGTSVEDVEAMKRL